MNAAGESDLDTLYGARPEEFTALRKELASAAKKRGDADAATQIAASRRPTTAAWVVNRLVRADATVGTRLADLSEGLRAAHAEMDGPRIRDLTAMQRKLVNELVRAAFDAADMADPSAALRDDVTDTLQAAIADPEVASRLGRLAKAERYSGFGGFGPSAAAPVAAPVATVRTVPPAPAGPSAADRRAAARRIAVATKDVDSARTAHDRAAAEVSECRRVVTTARRRYERLLEQLSAAEHDVDIASAALVAAEDAVSSAASRVEVATAALAEAEATVNQRN